MTINRMLDRMDDIQISEAKHGRRGNAVTAMSQRSSSEDLPSCTSSSPPPPDTVRWGLATTQPRRHARRAYSRTCRVTRPFVDRESMTHRESTCSPSRSSP